MDPSSLIGEAADNSVPIATFGWIVGAYIVTIALILAMTCMAFYFESSFFSLTAKEVANLKVKGTKAAKGLLALMERPQRTLSALVITKYTCITLLLTVLCSSLLWIKADPTSWEFWGIIAGIAFVGIFSTILFGEIIPTRIKEKSGYERLLKAYPFISLINTVLTPISFLLEKTPLIKRRMEMKTQHNISIDELSETLKLTSVEKKDEKDILQGIVNFGKICVDEIMRPRVDIVDIDIKNKFDEVINIIRESEYSRLPVYENSIDNVKGVLYIKDLLQHIDKGPDFPWQNLIREAYFVPETKKIDDLLSEFQEKRIHMAIVVDEFGGTSGIATLEDILEVIVGEICDEHDEDENKMYSAIDDKNYILEGKLPINDFFKIKKINTEPFEKRDWDADSLAGLILEINGDIPSPGDIIEYEGYKFTIISADDRRIKKVQLQIP
ncbi:MAG: gliding motility-associated protein GldE [Paludibacteraceae bacterium]|nr:gliding motility-associated protein GldE [Paludibacteraceae bacterium]